MKAGDISALLKSRIIGHPVRVHQEVTSTNDLALQLGADGAPEGFAIFAERQTHGRGRLGRHWQSHPGDSLSFSILLRPAWPEISRISLAVAVAVAQVVQRLTSHAVGIKWPNDIFIEGKKIAGILCEAVGGCVVVGIGLNVFQTETDFPAEIASRAGSLVMFSSHHIDRTQLAAALLNELDAIYSTLPAAFPQIIRECEQRSVLTGRSVRIETGGNVFSGTVTGIAPSGGITLRDATGITTTTTAGEVTLLTT